MNTDVILADDYPMIRQGFKLLLERHGIRVVGEADDGRGAVELARELKPDVAVLDLAMPGVSGLEAARQTAEAHRARLMKRLGIHTTAGLVRYAIREGMISP